MGLSKSQKKTYAVFAPIPVAILSIVGSLLTLTTLYRSHKTGSELRTYHRLLLGVSISDIIFSLGWVFGPLPVPADFNLTGAAGNTFTCRLQGFFLTIGYATFTYNMMLMVYFLLVIRYSVREKTIAARVEPFMHLFPVLYHLSIGITCLVMGLYHVAGTQCWIKPTPVGCRNNPNVPCEKEIASFIDKYFVTFLLFFEALSVLSVLAVVGFTVWARYRHTQLLSFEHIFANSNPASDSGDENLPDAAAMSTEFYTVTRTSARQQRPSRMERRSRRVIVQCLLYGICFLNSSFWSNIYVVVTFTNEDYLQFYNRNFWTAVLALFFLPGQGIFNFFIYIRPRYKSIRASCKELPRKVALKEAIWYPVSNRRERIRRQRRHQTSTRAPPASDRGSGISPQGAEEEEDGRNFSSEIKSSTSEGRGGVVIIAAPVDLEASAGGSSSDHHHPAILSSAGSSRSSGRGAASTL